MNHRKAHSAETNDPVGPNCLSWRNLHRAVIFSPMKPRGNHSRGDFRSRVVGQTQTEHRIWAMHLWEFIMIEYAKTWLELKLDRRAVTALEYGLIAGVIVATIAVGFSILANGLSTKFSGIGGSL
jgi:Flp pilus assembly pilin Flp